MENNYYPKYLDNKPIGEDQFEGKSHERIATTIAEHIKSKSNSLRVLGIEGEWGSGKSNIIELLRNKLEGTHFIYIYDAWGHQEDSQRRAFLEELTEDLIQEEVLSEKTKYKNLSGKERNITWKEKVKFLLARKKETNKKTIPKLSIGIIIIGIVLIFTPILTLVTEILFDASTEWWKKLLLPLSPIILSIAAYLVASIKNWSFVNLSELFFIFKGKELENTTYEIFTDLEPSVKEFKDWIQSISIGLQNKDLVIVYDNMDRLPPEKVKELWSSIHTFFAEKQYEKINVIIPFDREHLQRAFEEKDNPTNEFINKTFSIVYRVTPPVLTDWKDFFKKKFEESFGDTQKKEFLTSLSIFDRLRKKFTPRDIIIFINELVTYKKIWNDEVPLRYIALFVIKKEFIFEAPQKNILSNNFLDAAKDLFTEDNKLQNYISALTFNVPVEKASQVLLIRDLEIVLREESELTINELAKSAHFIEILEEVIQNSDVIVDKTISVFSQLDISNVKGILIKERITKIWDTLTAKQCALGISKLDFEDKYQLLLLNSSKNSCLRLVKYLIQGFNNFEDIDGKNYYHSFKELEDSTENKKINISLAKHIKSRTVPPEVFLDYLHYANEDYKKYKLKTESVEFDNYISEKIPDKIVSISEKIDLSFVIDDYTFDVTKENIEALIEQGKLTEDNFYKILQIYKSISKEKPLAKVITVVNLYQLLQTISDEDEGYYDLIAIRLQYANTYIQQIQPQGWPDNTTQILTETDEEIVQELAKRIEYYEDYGDILLLALNWNQPLFLAVCKDLTINKYGSSRMKIMDVLPRFNEIITSIEISAESLLKRLDGWAEFAEKEIAIDNLEEVIPLYSFYEYSILYPLELTNNINKIAKDFINSFSEDTLIEEWNTEDSYVYETLYIFIDSNKIKTLPRNVYNSLKQILKKISRLEIDIPDEESIWQSFIEKTRNRSIAPTIRDIRDYYISNNNITSELFILFERFFREYGKLPEKPADITRTILGKIVNHDRCFDLILSNKDFYIPIINDAQEDAADFSDNIISRLENESENTELVDFAKKINVKLE